ncbi:MAG: N-6 DNA methylase [bacterium]
MMTDINNKFSAIIQRYTDAKNSGSLIDATEETVRTWINELLSIFGWNVQDTKQVLQERRLEADLREKLRNINSHNTRPDYTLVNGGVKLCFVDAKNITVNIESDSDVAFQIRSYGWSAGTKFSIVTNFEELAIYDCSQHPICGQPANFARLHYFTISEFVENFDLINTFLNREAVIDNLFQIQSPSGDSPDELFADFLCSIRVKLANSILAHNDTNIHHSDPLLIGLWVQIIINRVLFIRVCESRGLEEDGLLLRFAESDFWKTFKQSSYLDFYEHYDGPIFSRIETIHNLNIDNEIFAEMLSYLYYPYPYRFDVMPVKSISDIYDLFLGRRLKIENSVAIDTLKDEYRVSRGAVVTPTHIVQKVIEQTIPNSIISKLTIDEILSLTILDPACGSGVFLAELYDYISSVLIEKLQDSTDSYENIAFRLGNEIFLTIDGKRTIINNCLYGVDIDQEAVEVARMSMSLKVVDSCTPTLFQATGLLGHQILNGIGENIKCGNTLVSNDILDLCPQILSEATEIKNIKIFNWQEAFADVFSNGGFDYVIGNPPYVEVKNYNQGLPTMVEYIKRAYTTSKNGKIDLSIPFIERGLSLLNGNGRLGYIVQKRFFKTEYGKGVREYITTNNLLNSIYDYQDNNIFRSRITYVAIVVCDNNTDRNSDVKYCNSANRDVIQIPAQNFSEIPWDFSNLELQNIRMRLCQLGTIASTVEIKVGIQVLWDRAYQIKIAKVTDTNIAGKSGIDKSVNIEIGACKPIICNEGIAPFSFGSYSTYAIFPYRIDDNQVTPIPYTDFVNNYPNAGEYLDKHKEAITNSVETLPKKKLRLDPNEYWHLYTRVQNHGATYEKVCIPMTAKHPTAVVVNDKNVYCDNANMFFVYIPESTDVKMYALAAIVNSNIFSTLARSIANPQQGGYYKFNKQFLNPLPFPKLAFESEAEEIVRLANLGKQIEEYNKLIRVTTPAEKDSLKIAVAHIWTQIDSICDELYGINENERELLYAETRNDR